MRYSFLDLLVCPVSHEPLVVVAAEEKQVFIPGPYIEPAKRTSQPDAPIGALPAGFSPQTDLARALAAHASPTGDPARNETSIVYNAILVAPNSGRWYPVIDGLPELLPDSLRDWGRDKAFLATRTSGLPGGIGEILSRSIGWFDATPQFGDNHKHSEITLLDKVEDRTSFLGPGALSPFNPYAFFHSSELIRGFSCCLPYLGVNVGSYVLDSGSGYSWTTEWFMKMGVHAVGLEINRTYLDVGRKRMGPNQPHLVISDAENLPFTDGVFDAVLGFDAFHHIPDRPKAMRQFSRVMKPAGRVVLVEPGGAHEQHEVSQRVMKDFGTMEVGMELADVQGYITGIEEFNPARETFLYPVSSDDARSEIPIDGARDRSFIGWCLYTVIKKAVPEVS